MAHKGEKYQRKTSKKPIGQKHSTEMTCNKYNSINVDINEDSDTISPPQSRGRKASKAKGNQEEIYASNTEKKGNRDST